MNPQTTNLLLTLLVLLIALLQYLLRRAAQSDQVKELEARLAAAEAELEAILQQLASQ